MYVYLHREDGKWESGYWTPDGSWSAQQAFTKEEDACAEVSWLNGGDEPKHRTLVPMPH